MPDPRADLWQDIQRLRLHLDALIARAQDLKEFRVASDLGMADRIINHSTPHLLVPKEE